MTTQKAFDWVITQGGPALEGGSCQYRAGGLRCAVGWLIPDDLYNPDMEDCNVEEVLWSFPHLKSLPQFQALINRPEAYGTSLLADMQEAHDSAAIEYRDAPPSSGWAYRLLWKMRVVASKFNLEWNFE